MRNYASETIYLVTLEPIIPNDSIQGKLVRRIEPPGDGNWVLEDTTYRKRQIVCVWSLTRYFTDGEEDSDESLL